MILFAGAELVGHSARAIFATMCMMSWVTGLCVITGVAYVAKAPRVVELGAAVCTATQLVILW